jgi:hypothetical protein
MTASITAEAAATAAARPPATTLDRVRRLGSVVALIVAPWGFVVANAGYTWATRHGGSDETGTKALALAGAHLQVSRVILLAGMLGCLLIVPAVLACIGLARRSVLAFVGGALIVAGYICYFGVLMSTVTTIAMAERGGPLADYAAVIDASESDPWFAWVFALFAAGNLLGTLLFAMGLVRSRTASPWAAVLIMLWPPLHVTGLIVGNELFEVAGAILQAVGFAAIAVTLLRARSRS